MGKRSSEERIKNRKRTRIKRGNKIVTFDKALVPSGEEVIATAVKLKYNRQYKTFKFVGFYPEAKVFYKGMEVHNIHFEEVGGAYVNIADNMVVLINDKELFEHLKTQRNNEEN